MAKLDLTKLLAQDRLRRATAGTLAPVGIDWDVQLELSRPDWFRDGTRVSALLDALASTSWFGELDHFAPGNVEGAPFKDFGAVRDSIVASTPSTIAGGDPAVAMFAHGEPRMTVDIDQAQVALSLVMQERRLSLQVWFAAQLVAKYKGAVLGDLTEALTKLRAAWPDCYFSSAQAFPAFDKLRYPRTRPLRIANRAIHAVVDLLDRDLPLEGPPYVRDTRAMLDADVPPQVDRREHGRLVVMRWIDDPSDTQALADACSRHEQWLVRHVETRLAEGWNEAGDIEAFDVSELVELTSDELPEKPRSQKPVALIAANRASAVSLIDRARAAGFARVLYRDDRGKLWDPHPPGEWVPR